MRALRAQLFLAASLVLLLAPPGPAGASAREASDAVQVTALAVAEDADGDFVGVHAIVEAQVLAGGAGRVYVSTKPLAQTDMQGSARLASRVAASLLGADWEEYDYLVSFRSESAVIGGPSAGAVMALALTTALHNVREPDRPWALDATVAATGTINPDGTIGPVGGIPAKAEGAKEAGIKTFLYPAGLDVAITQVQGRQVQVDMAAHCQGLGIACRPAASLVDVLRAAGIDASQPTAPVPGTTDYADDLGPTVGQQVDRLAGRLARREADPRVEGLSATERARVAQEAGVAEERLASARAALDEGRYYLAATRSFQGSIQAGRAENLTAFYAAGGQQGQGAVVEAAIAGCAAAADAAGREVDGLRAEGITALYAIAAAQQRAAHARELLAQAEILHAEAARLEDWVQSLFASTFCVERAGTAGWWADLRGTFGAGPAFGDRDAFLDDALETAQEEVAYAQAVLGADLIQSAASHLASAHGHAAAGRIDAAVLEAVEAQTAASVAMQTAGGVAVPKAVLDEAVQSASRAIDTARSQGIEPLLSVSLVELSQDQNQTVDALSNLWTARSMALLEQSSPAAHFGDGGGLPTVSAGGPRVVPIVLGALLGAAGVLIVVVAAIALWRP